jgi:hypothetical protein
MAIDCCELNIDVLPFKIQPIDGTVDSTTSAGVRPVVHEIAVFGPVPELSLKHGDCVRGNGVEQLSSN